MTQTQPGSPAWTDSAERTRTYTWADPSVTLAALPGMSGIELLSAIGRGELPLPPVLRTLGMEPVDVGEGWIRFGMVPHEMHYNPIGTVHGGVLATMLDSAAGCAVHSVLPAGMGYTSMDLTSKYLRPVTVATGRIIATGTVLTRLTDRAGRGQAHRFAGSAARACHVELSHLQHRAGRRVSCPAVRTQSLRAPEDNARSYTWAQWAILGSNQ